MIAETESFTSQVGTRHAYRYCILAVAEVSRGCTAQLGTIICLARLPTNDRDRYRPRMFVGGVGRRTRLGLFRNSRANLPENREPPAAGLAGGTSENFTKKGFTTGSTRCPDSAVNAA